jgi:hypothetical protein
MTPPGMGNLRVHAQTSPAFVFRNERGIRRLVHTTNSPYDDDAFLIINFKD